MFGIERTRTYEYKQGDFYASCTYNVPTAEDMQTIYANKDNQKETEVFKKFVTKIESNDEELNGKTPSEVIKMPGSWLFVRKCSQAIFELGALGEVQKKDSGPVLPSSGEVSEAV